MDFLHSEVKTASKQKSSSEKNLSPQKYSTSIRLTGGEETASTKGGITKGKGRVGSRGNRTVEQAGEGQGDPLGLWRVSGRWYETWRRESWCDGKVRRSTQSTESSSTWGACQDTLGGWHGGFLVQRTIVSFSIVSRHFLCLLVLRRLRCSHTHRLGKAGPALPSRKT